MSASGWTRVAKGLHLVATDGATRITSAIVSSNVATKHLPELAASIVKAGGNSHYAAAAAVQTSPAAGSSVSVVKDDSSNRGDTTVTGASGQFYSSHYNEHSPPLFDSAVINNGMEGVQIMINDEKDGDGVNQRLGNSLDVMASAMHVPLETNNNNEIDSTPHGSIESDDKQKIQKVETAISQSDNPHTESAEIYDDEHQTQHLPEGSAVPTTRLSRAFGFASLGAGLAMGTVSELARRTFGQSTSTDPLVLSNDANAQRLTGSLRRMRGAAMKLGQMLSIQDESIAPPALTNALAQVRKGAEAMPSHQLMQQLEDQWGVNWRERIELEERPFAAASIGQVHRGTLVSPSSTSTTTRVAVKVQYPGVADSIESDLSNLSMLVNATGLAPPGLFLDNVIRVGRDELKIECDYQRELANQQRFQSLISSDPGLVADRFVVPQVIEELSTDRILVTELVRGGTIDKVVNLDQSERNRIGKAIMRLTMLELFVWRFMQTDPNWGNFLYDVRTRTTYLIDFGAAREYDEEFVRGYLNIVTANANRDEETLMKESVRMGFLTGEENDIMLEAHKLSGFCLGEPFQRYEPYDFKSSKITSRISEHGSVFLKHRLTPPPEEVYTLHRKLAGAYNLCIKLGAIVSCRDLL
eukprot:CAMPEP_0172321274 /NCGR_PEP_ID=MMETSP1058-20130122/42890_1 /TAXON_ID=83371 /ORGANISM="Detonula confervacea, Strain CCMP 353" /LENGTH=640 /DNA_ID=CAMNT_0013036737 /DNA_START=69 /DNA_END=1988 /DNA_ORIENTATION=-